MKKVYYCPECYKINPLKGYLKLDEGNHFCHQHNVPRIEKNIDIDDFKDISLATKTNSDCIEAMIKLKEEDPIEYQLKMAKFRELAKQRHEDYEEACRKSKEEQSKPKCPICGSTSITTGARGVNNFWGFLGASRTVNRCGNCGHTWTPR